MDRGGSEDHPDRREIVMQEKTKGLSRRGFLGLGAAVGASVAVGAVPTLAAASQPASPTDPQVGAVQVFVNNLGYETHGPKRLVFGGSSGSRPLPFQVLDTTSGAIVHRGTADFVGPVDDWDQHGVPPVPRVYWVGDFSSLTRPGQYVIAVGGNAKAPSGVSCPFLIEADLYARHTMSDVLHYFKGSRSSGQFDKRDRRLPIGQHGKQHVDVHGGWYDATADFGIHFNQVFRGPAAPFLVTTQVPLTAWVLFASHAQIARPKNPQFTQIANWLLDEAMYGADFLVRMQPRDGSFYASIEQPELDHPTPQYEPYALRFLETENGVPTLVSFRGGGGSAVAALAAASTFKVSGEYDSREYLAAAVRAFCYLQANNRKLNRGTPDNILDDSEILVAATELHKATGDRAYATIARARAHNLAARLTSWHQYRNYWRADGGDRPFFHPSNAGLPAAYLANYLGIAEPDERAALIQVLQKSLEFALATTREATNPFGYARQLVQDADGHRFTRFFFPHDVTPSTQQGGWWQGENARIASLATAARLVALHSAGNLAMELERYATDQLNWICGLNPYASCMLNGVGLNNPQYYDATGTWQVLPQAGGINNGITGSTVSGQGIRYEPGCRSDDFVADWPSDWRFMEQWLPHATWFLYATSIGPVAHSEDEGHT
ncbi:MAG: glycoside hydrolase family 9 protein [Rhodanobacteraceae bacterium]